MSSSEDRPRILVLGGGYAGVTTVVRLRSLAARGQARVTLVNEDNFHHLTTLLHQAIWRAGPEEATVYLPALLEPAVAFLRGRVRRIDPEARRVEVVTREGLKDLAYDVLVVALGWEPDFFGIPGVKEHGLVLDDLASAHLIHGRVEREMAAYDAHPEEGWRTHVLIGGGGFTGTELAGEVADWRRHLALTFDVDPVEIRVTVVEAADRLLPGLDPRLAADARRVLEAKGVEVLVGAPVASVAPHTVTLEDGRELRAGVLIWAGGVRGHHLVEEAGFAVDRKGRAHVDDGLRADGFSDVYVIGDCARWEGREGEPLPPTAQMAVQEGAHVARSLRRHLRGRGTKPFRPRREGVVVSLGRKDAVGLLVLGPARIRFHGWMARAVKHLALYRYLIKIRGFGAWRAP